MAKCCKAIKPDGTRCLQVSTLNEEGLCLWHDPERKRQAQAARKRGSKASNKKRMDGKIRTVSRDEAPPNPTTIAECVAYASWALGAVTTGAIDSRTAHEISVLIGQVQRGLKDSKISDDVAELREQLAELRRGTVGAVR